MTTPRSRAMAVLTVVAMLAIGLAAGIGLDRTLLSRSRDVRWRGARGGGGPFGMINEPIDTASRNRMRGRIVKRISDDLGLTAPQSHHVDSIFALNETRLDSLRNHVAPQLDSLRDQMRASISTVLTPEQRTKFTEMSRRFDERRRASSAHDHGGRDGDPPPRD